MILQRKPFRELLLRHSENNCDNLVETFRPKTLTIFLLKTQKVLKTGE